MKRKRIVWAALLCFVTAVALVGYTSAGAALPLGEISDAADTLPPAAVDAPPDAQPPLEEEPEILPGLLIAIRGPELADGTRLTIFAADGEIVTKAGLDAQIGVACTLTPGQAYTVETMDGLTAAFQLEENASITNVQGAAWTDGEVLYLTATPRCTLTVLASVAQLGPEETVSYLLTGPDYEQRIAAGREEGETLRKIMFADLDPGDYVLTAPDGQTRQISLSAQNPAVSISFE